MSKTKLPTTLGTARAALAAPLAAEDVEFVARAITGDDRHADVFAYASVHAVYDRLDLVVGVDGYDVELRAIDRDQWAIARIQIGDAVRESVGAGYGGDQAALLAQGKATTRAARQFGIGRSTRRSFGHVAEITPDRDRLHRDRRGRLVIGPAAEQELRGSYLVALQRDDERGRYLPVYGPALPNHGTDAYDPGRSRYADAPLAKGLAEAGQYFRRPFHPDAVTWMAGQRDDDDTVTPLAVVTRLTVEDYLDAVVGPQHWSFEVRAEPTHLIGRLTIFGRVREARGTGDSRYRQEARAFKRCAVQFGLGRYLYTDRLVTTVPKIGVHARAPRPHATPQLTADTIGLLRGEYRATITTAAFTARRGEPITDFEPVLEDDGRQIWWDADEGDETAAQDGPDAGGVPVYGTATLAPADYLIPVGGRDDPNTADTPPVTADVGESRAYAPRDTPPSVAPASDDVLTGSRDDTPVHQRARVTVPPPAAPTGQERPREQRPVGAPPATSTTTRLATPPPAVHNTGNTPPPPEPPRPVEQDQEQPAAPATEAEIAALVVDARQWQMEAAMVSLCRLAHHGDTTKQITTVTNMTRGEVRAVHAVLGAAHQCAVEDVELDTRLIPGAQCRMQQRAANGAPEHETRIEVLQRLYAYLNARARSLNTNPQQQVAS